MARPAPAVDRAVAILNFLAAHPDESFTLSELARRLDINKATAHAMTAALTDAGYLLRHPQEKTYSLGPALVAVGNAAAARQFEVVDYARDEMHRVADEAGVPCVASAVLGSEIVLLAAAGDPGPLGPQLKVGQRLPLAPPLGTVFMAWSEPADIDAWLCRLGSGAGDADLARYREAVAAVRHRGYAVALEADARVRLGRALAELPEEPRAAYLRRVVERLVEELGHEEYILLELDPQESYRISLIAAPVFGPDGRVVLALTLFGFRGRIAAEQVPDLADRLLEAAGRVTRAIHGRAPDDVATAASYTGGAA